MAIFAIDNFETDSGERISETLHKYEDANTFVRLTVQNTYRNTSEEWIRMSGVGKLAHIQDDIWSVFESYGDFDVSFTVRDIMSLTVMTDDDAPPRLYIQIVVSV